MERSEISVELDNEIDKRKTYSRFDFILNHLLVIIIIFCSSFAGFSQFFEYKNASVISIVAAIPAFVFLLQSTFKWDQKAEWHWDYRRRLIAIRREMRDQDLSSADASKKLNLLEEQLAGSFPGLNQPTSKEE